MKVKLVVNSASIKCEHCPESGELTIPPISGILVTGQWVASKYDVLVPINIKPFRHCKKRSDKEGIDLCIPENIRQWENTKDDIDILEGIPAITDKSFAICYYLGSNKITINDSGQGLVEVDEILYWEFPDLEELLNSEVKFNYYGENLTIKEICNILGLLEEDEDGRTRLDILWEVCRAETKNQGLVIDPRLFLGIYFSEGTGSFNTLPTDNKNSGHIANPNAISDTNSAYNILIGKILAYPIYQDLFKDYCDMYKTKTTGGARAYNGGLFEYIQYRLPWLAPTENGYASTNKMYASGGKWNGTVAQWMGQAMQAIGMNGDPFDLAKEYSDYIGLQTHDWLPSSDIGKMREESKGSWIRVQYYYYPNPNDTSKKEYTDAIINVSDLNNLPSNLVGYTDPGKWDFTITHVYVDNEPGNYGGKNVGQRANDYFN